MRGGGWNNQIKCLKAANQILKKKEKNKKRHSRYIYIGKQE